MIGLHTCTIKMRKKERKFNYISIDNMNSCFQIIVCTNRKFASIIKADNSFNTLTKLCIDVIKR